MSLKALVIQDKPKVLPACNLQLDFPFFLLLWVLTSTDAKPTKSTNTFIDVNKLQQADHACQIACTFIS